MKVLILAAGYGTRLARDLATSNEYSHLIGCPKPLLPVAGKPLINYWMETLASRVKQTDVYIIVNDSNKDKFIAWRKEFPSVQIISDGSTINDNRLGAVGCIQLVVKQASISDDLMIIAGDTLFYQDFSLSHFIESFDSLQLLHPQGCSLITYYNCSDEEVCKHGILEVDSEGIVKALIEKPKAEDTNSRKACPAFYLLAKQSLSLLDDFMEDNKDLPLSARDAPGNFLRYLCSRQKVSAIGTSGRYDVGGLQSYINCNKNFRHNDIK